MNLFRRRQVEPEKPEPTLFAMVADLQAKVAAAESRVRTVEAEQAAMHDEVRKWMRRATAAERRVEAVRGGNQEPMPEPGETTAEATPRPVRRLWGARARIAARRARPVPATNGSGVESTEGED